MKNENLNRKNYGMEQFENIVFVDIDGVFNHMNIHCTYKFLEESVETLNMLYEKYNINLVLSSSWRHAYSFSFMQKLFQDNGIKAPLIDKTPIIVSKQEDKKSFCLGDLDIENDDFFSRDYEIYEWIHMFKPKHFLILDDFEMKMPFLRTHQLVTLYWGNKESDLALRKKYFDICCNILEQNNEMLGD